MEFKDYYKVLQIETHASQDDIRQAYRRLVQKFHPDMNPAVDAEEQFKEIQEAYDILKDPRKRTLYNYSYKTIKPYTYDWIRTKVQSWWYLYAQNRAKRKASARIYSQQHKQLPLSLFLLGGGVFLLLLLLVGGIFIAQNQELTQPQPPVALTETEQHRIVTAILQGNPDGIEKLKLLPLDTQLTIFQQSGVKHAVINFFINHSERDIITTLKSFDTVIQEDVFKKDEIIKRLLMAHYYRLADESALAEDFDHALQLLDNLNAYLENLPGFMAKYNAIQTQKVERVTELVAQYKQCLALTDHPLLEKTPCFERTRRSIARLEPTHSVLTEPDLNKIYATAIEQALTEKAFKQVEQLITAWQQLLPQQNAQRQAFQQKLVSQRQVENIIAVLTQGDNKEIAKNLGYLKNVDGSLQEEILKQPKVRENLLSFHMKELLTLMQLADKPVQPYLRLVEQFDPEAETLDTKEKPTTEIQNQAPTELPLVKNKTTALLKKCKHYYNIKHLTRGKETALSCYKKVLARDPQNAAALAGLEKIEHLFQIWAENALRRGEWNKVTYYLQGLEKVNPQAAILTEIREQLRWKKAQQAERARAKKRNIPQQAAQVVSPSVRQKTPVKQRKSVKQRHSANITPSQLTQQPQAKSVVDKKVEKRQDTVSQCIGCSCVDLLRQLSIGVKPLTANQRAFLGRCY